MKHLINPTIASVVFGLLVGAITWIVVPDYTVAFGIIGACCVFLGLAEYK